MHGPMYRIKASATYRQDLACHGEDVIWDRYVRANIGWAENTTEENIILADKAWRGVILRHRRSYTKVGRLLNRINYAIVARSDR